MKTIFVIIKKELTDLFRDRRTLITMLVIPLLIFPLMFNITGKIMSSQMHKEQAKTLRIGIVDHNNALPLVDMISQHKDITVTLYPGVAGFDSLLKDDKLDGALEIGRSFDHRVDSLRTGQINFYYKSSNWAVRERMMDVIGLYKSQLLQSRLYQLHIAEASITPLIVRMHDVSTSREKFGKTIGGILPYIFIIFCFIGCMYPAIEMFTNEKERGTLETLLTAPISRLEILSGKMSVVAFMGLISALLSILGLSFGLKQFMKTMPADVTGSLSSLLIPSNILMLLFMLIPLVIFFAGILTVITTHARSYKEAQMSISPMMFLVILPALIGVMPGIDLSPATAVIPITNISLATKDILAGTISYPLYALVLASLMVYAFIGVLVSALWFRNEKHVLKT